MKKSSLEKFWNGVHLEDEEREDLEIQWMQEVTTEMKEREINNLEWVDREGWRKKNKIKT